MPIRSDLRSLSDTPDQDPRKDPGPPASGQDSLQPIHERALSFKILSLRKLAPGPRLDAWRVVPQGVPEAVGNRVYGPRFSMTEERTGNTMYPGADPESVAARAFRPSGWIQAGSVLDPIDPGSPIHSIGPMFSIIGIIGPIICQGSDARVAAGPLCAFGLVRRSPLAVVPRARR